MIPKEDNQPRKGINEKGMRTASQQKAYNRFWLFMEQEHGLILAESEMEDIIHEAQEFIKLK